MNQADIYKTITDRICAAIENGGLPPWRKPWITNLANIPRNAVSGKAYRGVNIFLLALQDFADPRWLTLKQANDLGGKIRKGEKGCSVILWKWVDIQDDGEDGAGLTKQIPYLRTFTVFNVSQTEGIIFPPIVATAPRNEAEKIATAESIICGYIDGPAIKHGGSKAGYVPSHDLVVMPQPEDFRSMEVYYGTLFHEILHSSGHPKRLNRPGVADYDHFGSEQYSREELIAEIGSAFLCGSAGIESGFDRSAAYVKGWLTALKNDPRLIVQAAGQAQKAADYILLGAQEREEENELQAA